MKQNDSKSEPLTSPVDPFVVMSAPNGARLTQFDHVKLPISPAELADCAQELVDVGVSILHLHVRDDNNRHSLNASRYREAIAAVKARVGEKLIIQVTTEAVGIYNRCQQMALVRELMPEAVSLALREFCPDDSHLEQAGNFFREITTAGVWPQYILYSAEEVLRFETLRQQNFFGQEKPFALFVLGRYSDTLTGDPAELDAFLSAFEPGSFPWAVCCFGGTEFQAVRQASLLGGHARIGFENNRFLPNGNTAKDNAHLIEATLASESLDGIHRPLASADWVRKYLMNANSI